MTAPADRTSAAPTVAAGSSVPAPDRTAAAVLPVHPPEAGPGTEPGPRPGRRRAASTHDGRPGRSAPVLTQRGLAAALAGMLAILLGLLASRPGAAACGVALVLPVLWDLVARRRTPATATVLLDGTDPEVGHVNARIAIDAPDAVETAVVRVSTPGYRSGLARVAVDGQREIGARLATARTGVRPLFRADLLLEAPGGAWAQLAPTAAPIPVAVHPAPIALPAGPLPPRLDGLSGPHRSRRIGDGHELHDVAPFRPGDRLRRIDWRMSARRGVDPRSGSLDTLYVRRTLAGADATVMIVVDSRDDLAGDPGTWAGVARRPDEPGSLDLARQAAVSLARTYLHQGDRVGVHDLGRLTTAVRPAAGRRHLRRISDAVVRFEPDARLPIRVRAPQVPSGALVVVCSTFMDDGALDALEQWRGLGHRVVAVDVLPRLDTTWIGGAEQLATRLVLVERNLRLDRAARLGADLIRWSEDPVRDVLIGTRRRQR